MHSSNTSEPVASPPGRETASLSPLLPPFLLRPSAFLWLWILPLGILLLLNFQGYQLIEGNMADAQRHSAHLIGAGNLAVFLAGIGGWLYGWVRSLKPIAQAMLHPAWALAAIVLPAAYLWFAVATVDDALPRNVRSWLYPDTQFFSNQFSFALLPLFWGILRLAGIRPVEGFGKAFSISLGVAIGAPVLLYLGFITLTHAHLNSVSPILVAVGIVVAGILMFVALARALLLGLRHAKTWGPTGERLAILFFALIFPLGGLWLNRSIPFPVDFQAWEVYALVVVNTAILLLASYRHAAWPRSSLYLLSATLPFSLYFFIVFLPYTPLSILAVIAMGAGFLVLAPVLLFVLHLHLFHQARLSVASGPDARRVLLGCALSFLILPAFFTARGLADKAALNAALDYVYSPSIETQHNEYTSSLLNLRRALNNHRQYKNGIFYPLLSPFYSWLVFDNLVLPDDKLIKLEKTFFGEAGLNTSNDLFRSGRSGNRESTVRDQSRMPRAQPVPRTVALQSLHVGIAPVDQASAVLTLSFTLQNTGTAPAEYVKSLPLPAGVYVSGFRLQIDGKPVPGRITEKKTALWVYTMIRDSERRDPGLLYYNGADELELRVFPVVPERPSVVEIDFLVPAPAAALEITKSIADPIEVLRQAAALVNPTLITSGNSVALIGAQTLSSLPIVPREPYLHIIVDRSAKTGFKGSLSEAIATLQKTFPAARRGRVSLVNHDVVDAVDALTPLADLTSLDAAKLDHLVLPSGGFSLDRALASAIRRHRDVDLDHPASPTSLPPRPIFVVLSNNDTPLPLQLEFTKEWSDLLPQLEIHQLGSAGLLSLQHGTGSIDTPLIRLAGTVRPLNTHGIVRFPKSAGHETVEYYDPIVAQWKPLPEIVDRANEGQWAQAFALQLEQQDYSRSPGDSAFDLKSLVATSRETGILIPSTSYIVVENSAQWRMLEISERQKLDQNSALAFRETPEPSVIVLILGFAGYVMIRRLRTRRAIPA